MSHDETPPNDLATPVSPGSEESSEANTPLDEPGSNSPSDVPRRVPSLRSVSDPHNMNPNSTALGFLDNVRRPGPPSASFSSGAGAGMDNSVLAKARALHQQRLQKGLTPTSSSPTSPISAPIGGAPPNGFPGNLRMPGALQRPPPPGHPKSAPALPKPSLSERRSKVGGLGMKLSDMTGGSPSPTMRRAGAPKLTDMNNGAGSNNGATNGTNHGSKMDDFKKYIDTETGWITIEGAATITRTGVNFANGQTFSISLDEVEVMGELGKGNYGTVFKVKHARPRNPRFGQGLSGAKTMALQQSKTDPTPIRGEVEGDNDVGVKEDGTTGITMAMKEIRLELDDAKFTTILKELVILHECVSPYIIDFYGAFFQEGAVYMCIEYMDGGSIDKLYSGGIPENILRKITYSTVMGLK